MKNGIAKTLLLSTLLFAAVPAMAVIMPVQVVNTPTGPAYAATNGAPVYTTDTVTGDVGPLVNVGLKDIVHWGQTTLNPAWVDARGMALYNYDLDTFGTSNCDGACAAAWVPLRAQKNVVGIDEWSVVTRHDGSKQWAFRGSPLYTYINDTMPGQVTGEGVNGFHLAD